MDVKVVVTTWRDELNGVAEGWCDEELFELDAEAELLLLLLFPLDDWA